MSTVIKGGYCSGRIPRSSSGSSILLPLLLTALAAVIVTMPMSVAAADDDDKEEEKEQCIGWIWAVFGDCVWTHTEKASFYVGLSSLLCWLVAQLPQLIENMRRGDASSLSPLFLLQWLLGDVSNLVGALLTGQLATQIIVAMYFVTMDVALWAQWIFYRIRNNKRNIKRKGFNDDDSHGTTHHRHDMLMEDDTSSASISIPILHQNQHQRLQQRTTDATTPSSRYNDTYGYGHGDMGGEGKEEGYQDSARNNGIGVDTTTINARTLLPLVAVVACSTLLISTQLLHTMHSTEQHSMNNGGSQTVVGAHRTLLWNQMEEQEGSDSLFPPQTLEGILGYAIGIFSAIMYLGSRMPQIYKNFRRRTTDGLSPVLFFCAFMGNLTYSISIFLFSREADFLLSKAPWIVGSAGVLVLDFVMLMQFLFFRVMFGKDNKAEGAEATTGLGDMAGDDRWHDSDSYDDTPHVKEEVVELGRDSSSIYNLT